MKLILIALALALLGACSSSTVTAGQRLVAEYHVVVTGDSALAIEANSQGAAICAVGDVAVAVVRVADDGAAHELGGFNHAGGGSARAYAWRQGADGWQLVRLTAADGQATYPQPYRRCAGAAAFTGAATSQDTERVVWQEPAR